MDTPPATPQKAPRYQHRQVSPHEQVLELSAFIATKYSLVTVPVESGEGQEYCTLIAGLHSSSRCC